MNKIIFIVISIFFLLSCSDSIEDNKTIYYNVKWEDIAHYLPKDYPVLYLKDAKYFGGKYEYIDKVEIENKGEVISLNLYIYDTDNSYIVYDAYDDTIEKIKPFYDEFDKYDCDFIKYTEECNIYGCRISNMHKKCTSTGTSKGHNIEVLFEDNEYEYNNGSIALKFTIQEQGKGEIIVPSNELSNIKHFFVNYRTIFAISNNNNLYSWGRNNTGILGIGKRCDYTDITSGGYFVESPCDEDFPVKLNLSNVKNLYTSSNGFALALTEDGKLYAWGNNDYGHLGTRDNLHRTLPTEIKGFHDTVNNIYLFDPEYEYGSTVFALSNNKLYAWGKNNRYGILGVGDQENRNYPTEIMNINGNIRKFYYHDNSFYLLTDTNKLYVWGSNARGKLGIGDQEDRYAPVENTNINGIIKDISFSNNSIYITTEDKKIFAWGDNLQGQLGLGNDLSGSIQTAPKEILNISGKVEKIYVHNDSVYALTEDNNLYAWGINSNCNLGIGGYNYGKCNNADSPQNIQGIQGIIKNIFTYEDSIYTITDKALYAWGKNNYGQLGVGDKEIKSQPVEIKGVDLNIKDLRYNDGSLYLITEDKLYSWGNNIYGRLGIGTNEDVFIPTQISDINNYVMDLFFYANTVFALTNDNKLYSWGANNEYGILGLGDLENRNTPKEIIGIEGKIKAFDNTFTSMFLLSDNGKIYTWGKDIGTPYGKPYPETVKYLLR